MPTNRDILIKLFWEHAQFGWRSQELIANRSECYRSYRLMVTKLTQKSIGMMVNSHERSQTRKLLEERYGADLAMSETELGFPSDPAAYDLKSWQLVFDRLKALYGKDVGVSRRTGKDLRKYKPNNNLPRTLLQFTRLDEYQFVCAGTDAHLGLTVRFQEFPREHLYRLESDQKIVLEFDDWPLVWSRDWG